MKRIVNSVTMSAAIVFFFVCVLSACSSEKGGINQPVDYKKALTAINPDFMISPDEAFFMAPAQGQGRPDVFGKCFLAILHVVNRKEIKTIWRG